MKNFILIALLISTLNVFADGDATCTTCKSLVEAEANLKKNSSGALKDARKSLIEFEFSKNSKERALEVVAYVKLGVQAIMRDHEGDSDQFFYNAYAEYPREFDAVIAKLPAPSRVLVKKSLSDSARNRSRGNG